ncbi:hypothetical protein THMIRHAS_10990 [Thiosulfatimonas sediminis]|uniref:Pyrroline-5-carboxylate reductase catalytic N-terminal domain-containing protein n=1 Tax=Thiosulfatimonas sediminis TaxID=2675054 RepID=A0A6F8PUE9_9GAMM|nr:hypothetical protein [Thiosulfatimonas sediminis]BBP45726.1 hypothetical protein THMIRHAS_10990 [Thiosulfatimonas sediminis]
MKNPIIVVGLGELGSVFARGFLRLGYPVQGAMRNQDLNVLAKDIPEPQAVLIAVGEADIATVLQTIPSAWQERIILLQNELLPRDWIAAKLPTPTVISVWFEKKKGMDSKVVIPSPIYGSQAKLVFDALGKLDLPAYIVDTEAELLYELIRKNLYILTTNIAGLEVGGNVHQLQTEHPQLLQDVAQDILEIQAYLSGQTQDADRLMTGLLEAFAGDPEHGCMGRSAPARLKRALSFADQANLEVATLRRIAQQRL